MWILTCNQHSLSWAPDPHLRAVSLHTCLCAGFGWRRAKLGTAGLGWALGAASSNLSFFWGWREVIPKVLEVQGELGLHPLKVVMLNSGPSASQGIGTIMGYEIYSSSRGVLDVSPALYLLGDRMRLRWLVGWRPIGFHFILFKMDRTQRPSVLHVQGSSWAGAYQKENIVILDVPLTHICEIRIKPQFLTACLKIYLKFVYSDVIVSQSGLAWKGP